ncbi:uncharacterized protein LOC122523809 [Polistes fuscatus]|uniref:uncharacterized protein LOC122523809 n=1 Tax=Polistes fuscatus TaxID=30207 RepID=UPI001CA89DCE|nr:uncharacterized protein LOC122523809 [Polistes fuscatus]
MLPSPEEDLEERPGISLALSQAQPLVWDLVDLPQSSSFHRHLTKLLRITALIQKAVSCFKKVPGSSLSASPLNPADLEKAKTFWIRATQEAYFSPELRTLSEGQSLHKRHVLTRLTAFVDRVGILRVGGRLQNSQLDEDSKHPAILPPQSKFTNLVLSDAHARTMHGETQLTLSYIRRTFWIIGGRAPMKSFLKDCLTCARIRGVRAQQLMAPLPASRVTPSLVFETTGLDYAGPVVSDYTTEGFLKAFRRFTSRRGIPKTLRSDCDTNFQGANKQLKDLLSAATKESLKIQRLLANNGTNWIFNPPAAPHMGGKWEASVKSIKYHLKRTISNTLLMFEDFSTFLAQDEAVLNSRPLSSLSRDPDDIRALTPNGFKSAFSNFGEGGRRNVCKRIRPHPNGRHRRTISGKGLLSSSPTSNFRPQMAFARVIQVHPGKDGLCRVVTLKTATSTITRPIVKLAPLPLQPHTET